MSNKTQLSNNNTKLASLIQELQGKASGGSGAVETCTVTIRYKYPVVTGSSSYNNQSVSCAYTTVDENGNITTAYESATYHTLLCVCGSPVVISNVWSGYSLTFVLNKAELVTTQTGMNHVYKITAAPGQQATIEVTRGAATGSGGN